MLKIFLGMAGTGKTTAAIDDIKEMYWQAQAEEKKCKVGLFTFSHQNRIRISKKLSGTDIFDVFVPHEAKVFAHLKYTGSIDEWLSYDIMLFDELTLLDNSIDYKCLFPIFEQASGSEEKHVIITMDFNQICNSPFAARLLKLGLINNDVDLHKMCEQGTPLSLVEMIEDADDYCTNIFTDHEKISVDDITLLTENHRNDKFFNYNNENSVWHKLTQNYAAKENFDPLNLHENKVKSHFEKDRDGKEVLVPDMDTALIATEYVKKGYKILTATTDTRDEVLYAASREMCPAGRSIYYENDKLPPYRRRINHIFDVAVNDAVYAIQNDTYKHRRFFNGDELTIMKFDSTNNVVYLQNNASKKDVSFSVDLEEFDTYFAPVYAMCISKGQGSQFDKVVLYVKHEENNVNYNLLYTGLSRAMKDVVLLSDNYTTVEYKWTVPYNIMEDWNRESDKKRIRLNNVMNIVEGYEPATPPELYEEYLKSPNHDPNVTLDMFTRYITEKRSKLIYKYNSDIGLMNKYLLSRGVNPVYERYGRFDDISNIYTESDNRWEDRKKKYNGMNIEDIQKAYKSELNEIRPYIKIVEHGEGQNLQVYKNARYLRLLGVDMYSCILLLSDIPSYTENTGILPKKYLQQIENAYGGDLITNIEKCGNSNRSAARKNALLQYMDENGEFLKLDKEDDINNLEIVPTYSSDNKRPNWNEASHDIDGTVAKCEALGLGFGFNLQDSPYMIIDIDTKEAAEWFNTNYPDLADTIVTTNPNKEYSKHYWYRVDYIFPRRIGRGIDILGNATKSFVAESGRLRDAKELKYISSKQLLDIHTRAHAYEEIPVTDNTIKENSEQYA